MKKSRKSEIAVALGFDPEENISPVVVAAGRGALARDIIAEAERYGKRVIEDPALSQALIELPVGREAPELLYRSLALIFSLIYSMENSCADKYDKVSS